MKKVYFMSMALAAMLAMAGCSNDDIAGVGGDDATTMTLAEGEGIVAINLSNTGIGTRVARPLGSSAAANNVDHVKLAVYSKNGAAWTKAAVTIDEANDADNDMVIDWTPLTDEVASETGHQENNTKNVKLVGLQPNTTYKVVAYGYNGDSEPAYITENESTPGVFTAKPTAVEEIFAGESVEVTTNNNAMFPTEAVKVEMDRHVAGLLAYLMGIPTHYDGVLVEQVIVYANAKSTGFTLPYDEEEGLNGIADGWKVEKTPLLTFEMSKATNWNGGKPTDASYKFATVTGGVADGGEAPYATEYTSVPAKLTLKPNTMFGACYVMAYNQHVSSQTLTVELMGKKDGSNISSLKAFNVKSNKGTGNEQYQYDILRNNFYSIGQKFYSDNDKGDPDPDDEENPDPDDEDKPVNVGEETDEVMLIINDAWSVLHNMELE